MKLKSLGRYPFLFLLPVFAIPLFLYILTMIPGTVGGDAGELQYAPPLLALIHSTSLPLYALIGKLWAEIIPVGSMAYRMNLLSAVSTAAGCAVMAWFIWRIYGNRLIGAAAGLTLGLGASVWNQAVIADKYGFNVLLSALIVGTALWWDDAYSPSRGDETTQDARQTRRLYLMSLAFGIGLLHHRSLVLFGAGIALMVVFHLRAEIWRKWRQTLICLALVLVPALVMYPTVLPYMQSRGLSPLPDQPQSPADWVDFLLDRNMISTDALAFGDPVSIGRQLEIYIETMVADYTLFVPLIAVAGLAAMLWRRPPAGVFILVSYGLLAVLAANWRGHERQFTYFPPSFVVLIYAYAYGLVCLWRFIRERAALVRTDAGRVAAAISGVLVLVVLPAYQMVAAYPARWMDSVYGEPLDIWRQNLKTGDIGDRLTRRMAELPPDAVVVGDWEQITILWYEQHIDGVRPDLDIYYPIERYMNFSDRPVCVSRSIPVDAAAWHPTNIGALVCLNAEPDFNVPADFTPVGTALLTPDGETVMALAGYQADAAVYPQATHVPLTLAWQALVNNPADYSISLQVLDENWQPVWSRDIQAPVLGMYPTSYWTEGEVIRDYHEIEIPPTMPLGRYLWTVVVYRQAADGTFEQLRDENGQINILGGTFEVVAR